MLFKNHCFQNHKNSFIKITCLPIFLQVWLKNVFFSGAAYVLSYQLFRQCNRCIGNCITTAWTISILCFNGTYHFSEFELYVVLFLLMFFFCRNFDSWSYLATLLACAKMYWNLKIMRHNVYTETRRPYLFV